MLECNSISVRYGQKIRAISKVSLKVQEGEIVSLIGANGAGKSTLLKTISGLLRVEEGEISYRGRPIHRLPAHEISRLGIAHVPEGRRIFSRMTAQENLELGAGSNPRALTSQLEEVRRLFPILEQRGGQLGGTLSGGEQQMLAIARALMSKPRLLMLDEPSMGLAPILVEKIFQAIQEIVRGGTTVLLVEQNARLSLSISHRAYVLETGRVVLEGKGSDLLHDKSVQDAYLGS